jgi:hypothetical protein
MGAGMAAAKKIEKVTMPRMTATRLGTLSEMEGVLFKGAENCWDRGLDIGVICQAQRRHSVGDGQ